MKDTKAYQCNRIRVFTPNMTCWSREELTGFVDVTVIQGKDFCEAGGSLTILIGVLFVSP